jgi:uncharacterized protein (TIGR02145 family)
MASLFNTGGVVVQTLINSDEVPIPVVTDDIDLEAGGLLYGAGDVELVNKMDLGENVHNLIESSIYLTDYDNNIYTSVIIGNQEWIVENLKVTHYADGTSIPNLTDNTEWKADTTGAYCWYDNDRDYKTPYGALYNQYAVNNVHNLVYFKRGGVHEPGWRVPTTADILTLIDVLGAGDWSVVGGKLKEIGEIHWNTPNEGATDEVGWKGIGGGNRYIDILTGDGFGSMHVFGDYLTSEYGPGWEEGEFAYSYYLDYNETSISAGNFPRYCGQSVRCIRNI